MQRKVKIALILTAILITLPFVAVGLFWLVVILDGSGTWPFKPLERIENEIALANGGVESEVLLTASRESLHG